MNPFGHSLPPGLRQRDIGSDTYTCSRCGLVISEEEIDNDYSEAFDNVCLSCAAAQRAEEGQGSVGDKL